MSELPEAPCLVCHESHFRDLADPWRGASLLSDMSTTRERLGKAMCGTCGLVRRRFLPARDSHRSIFGADYSLFSKPPSPHVLHRQVAIAAWLHTVLGAISPNSILEVGCGDGSLLEALALFYPAAKRQGIEPVLRSVMQARSRGLDVSLGFDELIAIEGKADLVVSVNVIEHTTSPLVFLKSLSGALHSDSELIVICPDGDVPNYELLFYDHLYSIGSSALRSLCAQAGLMVTAVEKAPPELGPFHLVRARLSEGTCSVTAMFDPGHTSVAEAKDTYLRAWGDLDETLLGRVHGHEHMTAFGNGDIAALLSLHAPRTWSSVEACLVDGTPSESTFLSLPLRAFNPSQTETILLAVRPGNHERVARRLTAAGSEVIRWDDLISQ